MTTNPTDQTPDNTTSSTWMSEATISGLQAKYADLIKNAQEADAATTSAREAVDAARVHLANCERIGAAMRRRINDTEILLAIAQGSAPLPTREAIHVTDEGLGLALGALRIAVIPDDATPEKLTEFAEVMRALYAAASGLASRADQAAKAAATVRGPRPSTPDVINSDGSTTITVKRCCNGCGNELGDATQAEITASVEGRPLPDVRGECPACSPRAEQPVTANGDDPLALDTPKGLPPATAAALQTSTEGGDTK